MFCIYRVTNNINGKTYIGQHKYKDTDDPMGNYRGSGILIKKAYKKYPIDAFSIEVLYKNIQYKDTVNAMEVYAIKKEREVGHSEYNISDGGNQVEANSIIRKHMSLAAKRKFKLYKKLGLPMKPEKFCYHPSRVLHTFWDAYTAYFMGFMRYGARSNSGNRYEKISIKAKGRPQPTEQRLHVSETYLKYRVEYSKYKANGGELKWNEWKGAFKRNEIRRVEE